MSSTSVEYAEGIYLDDGTLKKFKDADLRFNEKRCHFW